VQLLGFNFQFTTLAQLHDVPYDATWVVVSLMS